MITQSLCQSFKLDLMNAVHNFTSHTFKIALYTSAANLSDVTTAYTTTGEIVGAGYVAGGSSLVNVVPTLISGKAVASFNNINFPGLTASVRGALIYNSSAANAAVAVLDFGSDRVVSNQTLTITFPSVDQTNAILRIA